LAEFPLFFRDANFRAYIVGNMKYNLQVKDYWLKTFASKSRHDQESQMEAAQTRIEIMLGHPYVIDIVGQKLTTFSFENIMQFNRCVLVRLSSDMSYESKKIIGTIFISELLQAIQKRVNRRQFCIFVDEFQNFASYDDFSILVTQAPKFGIATTIAHHERVGQLAEDPAIIGATSAIANKVLFQITARDAIDFAPEFAEKPPTEIKHEPELIVAQEPVIELLKRGHRNERIQESVTSLLRPWADNIKRLKEKIDSERIGRTALVDEATLYRDQASIAQMDARMAGNYYTTLMQGAIEEGKGFFNRCNGSS
jgi:hypothetical protein